MTNITVIAHNIRSTHNVGSIFRTCEGFGITRLILSGYTPYPSIDNDSRLPHLRDKISRQIHKTALGAETMVAFEHFDHIEEWIATNPATPIVALEQATTSVNLRDFVAPEEFALLLGEEVHGIEQSLIEHVQFIVEIPMFGSKESFNVSVATGIALYALTNNTT